MNTSSPEGGDSKDPYLKLLPSELQHSTRPDVRTWDISQTIPELSYLTHGFFRYYGKFPPTLARKIIRDFRPGAGEIILDNLMGCGTTLVEARLERMESVGMDASPLAVLAAQVKTHTDVRLLEVPLAMETVRILFQTREVPVLEGKDFHKWFSSETNRNLARLRAALLSLPPGPVRSFLSLAFFAIIRRVSFAFDGEVRPHVNAHKKPRDVWQAFSKKVYEMVERMYEYEALVRTAPPAFAQRGDARDPSSVLSPYHQKIGLVLSHPPYLNCFDYIPVFRLEYLWAVGFEAELGTDWTYNGLRGAQLKSWPASPPIQEAYFSGLTQIYSALLPFLSPSAHLAVVLGDCTIRGVLLPVLDTFAERMSSQGFRLVRTLLRTTHYATGKYAYAHRADYHGTAEKRDGVLVFRRD